MLRDGIYRIFLPPNGWWETDSGILNRILMRLKSSNSEGDTKKPKLTLGNLVQLVLMGAGAPGGRRFSHLRYKCK